MRREHQTVIEVDSSAGEEEEEREAIDRSRKSVLLHDAVPKDELFILCGGRQ